MTAKKSTGSETPAEIQKAELRRRRAKWNEAKSEEATDDKPFALESVPASSKHFCWFCFENDRELLVAATTGVRFCRECARSLLELATVYVPDQNELIGPLVNACAAAAAVVDASANQLIVAQLKYCIQHAAEWFSVGPMAEPAWTEADAASVEPRQCELPMPDATAAQAQEGPPR